MQTIFLEEPYHGCIIFFAINKMLQTTFLEKAYSGINISQKLLT